MHVAQLKKFLVLIQQGEAVPPPVGWGQCTIANGARLSVVPLLQQALDVLGRRGDLRQALLPAIAFLGPARTRVHAIVLLATQRRRESVFVVPFDCYSLA